jgi:hypothetical protein
MAIDGHSRPLWQATPAHRPQDGPCCGRAIDFAAGVRLGEGPSRRTGLCLSESGGENNSLGESPEAGGWLLWWIMDVGDGR